MRRKILVEKNRNKVEKTISLNLENTEKLAKLVCEKIKKERAFGIKTVLNLVGAGLLTAIESMPAHTVSRARTSLYLPDPEVYDFIKKKNIPYLRRLLRRLEKQKLVEIEEKDGKQEIKITQNGRVKILKGAIDELRVDKPALWDGKWWLVSYDLPEEMGIFREQIRRYFIKWGFYPIHKSVYLHAFPCYNEVEFLRQFFGIGEFIKIFKVEKIENDKAFKEFFCL